jgi:hypothetical protein
MNLLSWLNTDLYSTYRDKVNNIVSGLKEGAENKILVAKGADTNPSWENAWTDWTLVSLSDGLNTTDFMVEPTDIDKLRYRKSVVLNQVQIAGNIIIKNSGLVPQGFAGVFTLPSGHIPSRRVLDVVFKEESSTREQGITGIIGTDGIVIIANTSQYPSFNGEHYYFNIIFPLS